MILLKTDGEMCGRQDWGWPKRELLFTLLIIVSQWTFVFLFALLFYSAVPQPQASLPGLYGYHGSVWWAAVKCVMFTAGAVSDCCSMWSSLGGVGLKKGATESAFYQVITRHLKQVLSVLSSEVFFSFFTLIIIFRLNGEIRGKYDFSLSYQTFYNTIFKSIMFMF